MLRITLNMSMRSAHVESNSQLDQENVVWFIDSTVLSIDRTTGEKNNQRTVYNGHTRKHALRFQAITTPEGLRAHMYGPKVGRRHEMFLYADSRVEQFLSAVLQLGDEQFVFYGDSEYNRHEFLEISYEG